MKKIFFLTAAVLVTVYFAGCGNNDEIITAEKNQP